MEKKVISKFSDFTRNKENPFLQEALETVNSNIVKKYRSATNTDQKAVLQAIDPNTGELLGHTSFIRQVEVDEEKFAKIYLSNFKLFYELSERSIRVLDYILKQLKKDSDEFFFYIDDCLEYTGYVAKKVIYSGLAELITAKIIAKGRTDTSFFINITVLFNGNRISFVNTYIKKEAAKEVNQQKKELIAIENQPSLIPGLFDDNE